MKRIKKVTNSERQHLETQKELYIAGVSLLALIAIMTLYYLYG